MGTLQLKMLQKGLLLLLCGLVLVQARTELDSQWEDFKSKYMKEYEVFEEETRRAIWEDNHDFIERHNAAYEAGIETYSVGENEHSDLTNMEFASMLTGLQTMELTETAEMFEPVDYSDVRATVDWRTDGYVTPVKNQGRCGSCWAFSATGSLEGQHYKKTGHLVSLSEQQLVDCSSANYGCKGGWVYKAFDYIKTHHGIASESAYPYKGVKGHCHFHTNDAVATLTGWVHVRGGSETDLQAAVSQKGPISVAIDASHRGFQMYKHGVYHDSNCSPRNLNHAVLVVGYGQETGGKYWLVKNSWGRSWGNQGYINMAKDRHNHCGIASQAYYPTV